jgi:hypothetical protein
LSVKVIRNLAFPLSKGNKIKCPLNKDALVVEEWFYGFRQRQPEISLRNPEASFAVRTRSFNETNVDKFYFIAGVCVVVEKKFPLRMILRLVKPG